MWPQWKNGPEPEGEEWSKLVCSCGCLTPVLSISLGPRPRSNCHSGILTICSGSMSQPSAGQVISLWVHWADLGWLIATHRPLWKPWSWGGGKWAKCDLLLETETTRARSRLKHKDPARFLMMATSSWRVPEPNQSVGKALYDHRTCTQGKQRFGNT